MLLWLSVICRHSTEAVHSVSVMPVGHECLNLTQQGNKLIMWASSIFRCWGDFHHRYHIIVVWEISLKLTNHVHVYTAPYFMTYSCKNNNFSIQFLASYLVAKCFIFTWFPPHLTYHILLDVHHYTQVHGRSTEKLTADLESARFITSISIKTWKWASAKFFS